MTKNFCDLCGSPAVSYPRMRVDFPEKEWSGTLFRSNSPNPTDGRWVPYVELTLVFILNQTKSSITTHQPDLCAKCIAFLLRKIADDTSAPE